MRALRRLLPILRGQRRRFALVVVAGAASQVGAVGAAVSAAWIVGLAADGATGARLRMPALVVGALVLVRVACAWLESWAAHDLAYRVMGDLRIGVFDGLERVAPARTLGRRSGDAGAAAMADVEQLEWFYAHTVAQLVVGLATPVVAVGGLVVIDPVLGLVATPFLVALATVPGWLARAAERQGVAVRARLATLHADVVDGIQGLAELVAFGRADDHAARLERRSHDLARAQRAYGVRAGAEAAAADLLVGGAMLAVLVTAGSLAVRDEISQASFAVAVILAGSSLAVVSEIVATLRGVGVLRAAAGRVFAIADAPATVVESPDPRPLPPSRDDGPAVAFEGVHFGYTADRRVLHDVSFAVAAGETVALVGPSGAGKSTCANLLVRFWDVDAGAVRIGGVDVRDLALADLRRTVALIPQDAYLFNATIADNIRIARPTADDREVHEAARRALVAVFADPLPDGLDTVVGERGAALSGGQIQRVALARALLRGADVLVLDEPVSSIDAEGARVLHDAIVRAPADRPRTTIVIAHRLSTIARADRVVLLDEGRVVATGSHRSLLDSSPAYRQLLAGQVEPG